MSQDQHSYEQCQTAVTQYTCCEYAILIIAFVSASRMQNADF